MLTNPLVTVENDLRMICKLPVRRPGRGVSGSSSGSIREDEAPDGMEFVASTSTSALDPYTSGRSAKFFSDELIIGGSTGVAHLEEGLPQSGAGGDCDLDRDGITALRTAYCFFVFDVSDLHTHTHSDTLQR